VNACLVAYTFYESDFRVMRYAEALVNRGDQVDVIALRGLGAKAYEVIKGVRVFRVQDRIVNEKGKFSYLFRILKFLLRSGWFLGRLHLRQPYDLVHIHSVPDFLVFAAILPKLFGAKIVLDIHDILPEFYASKFSRGQKGLLFKLVAFVERISSAFADHVIIANHIWEKKLIARSVKPAKLTALINYPDTSIFFPRKRTREENEFKMLYPGTVSWHQGLDIAVRALALIKDKAPHASLHIYGGGTHRSYIEELIRHLGLGDRVFLKPGMPLRDLAEVVAQVDLGVVPKRNDQFGGEAFSTKSLEFMAAGIPIIIAKTKVDRYYFNDSLVKFFKPDNVEDLADAMLTMIRDKSLRNRLAKNGLEFVNKNTWDGKKHIYLDLVDELVDKGRGQKSEV
jgi:glycosyltransferase involved in cell wall biosynthesis